MANLEFVFIDFPGHDSPAMLWLRANASHPARRRVAPAAATEVCLVVSSARPTHVGVILFTTYQYVPMQSAVILQHQAHPIKHWFHFTQSCKEDHTNQLFGPCCT